jgi:hypothetical protein
MDLSGGFHDAGDHIKFGIPIGVAGITVGMARLQFPDAFIENGLDGHAQRILDHFAEYYRKCVIWNGNTPHAFAYQVGDGHEAPSGWGGDHTYWGPPESQTGTTIGARRRARFTNLTSAHPGTDQVGVAAALLALNYINYGNPEDLRVAVALYSWAQAGHKGLARDGPNDFYRSSRWDDKMALAAEFLFIATGEQRYVTESMALPSGGSWDHHSGHPVSWDGVWPYVNVLRGVRNASGAGQGWEAVRTNMGQVNSRLTNTAFFEPMSWGNTRYNCGFQFIGLMHQFHNPTHANNYANWAESQMSFILGNNNINGGTSFVVGINAPWATNAHHRAASGFSGWEAFNRNDPVRNQLTGALIGGPIGGVYNNNISEYRYTEVASDYNAMLVGAAAGLWTLRGRTHQVPSPLPQTGVFREVAGGPEPCPTCNNTRCTCPRPCPTCGENQPCGNASCAPPEPCGVCNAVNAVDCTCPETGITVVHDVWRCTSCNTDKLRITTTLVTFSTTTQTFTTTVRSSAKRSLASAVLESCAGSTRRTVNGQQQQPPVQPNCTTCNNNPCSCETTPPPQTCSSCNRPLAECSCGPPVSGVTVEGTIEAVVMTRDSGGISVTAVGFPGHGEPFDFRVQIPLDTPFNMAGSSAPPGITWTVNGNVLVISGQGNVEWGNGLGNAWGG